MTLPRLERYGADDYGPIADRIKNVKRLPTAKRGWGPGWPECEPKKIVHAEANRINGLRVRTEIRPLIEYLIKAGNALDYDMRKAAEPDGGVGSYYCRAIKNSKPQVGSVHSIGCAIDQNTRGNPRFVFPVRSVTPPEIVWMWEASGFYWGGRFGKGWTDPMHFEYMFPPSEVATDLDNAKAAFATLGGVTLYPTLTLGATNRTMVRVLQSLLNAWDVLDQVDTEPLLEEGDFESDTDDAVRDFQKRHHLVVDGIVGPITWGALNDLP